MIVSTGCSQKNGSVGVVSEQVVTGTGIRGFRDVNILLGGKVVMLVG
jgi:hypothetical protein